MKRYIWYDVHGVVLRKLYTGSVFSWGGYLGLIFGLVSRVVKVFVLLFFLKKSTTSEVCHIILLLKC